MPEEDVDFRIQDLAPERLPDFIEFKNVHEMVEVIEHIIRLTGWRAEWLEGSTHFKIAINGENKCILVQISMPHAHRSFRDKNLMQAFTRRSERTAFINGLNSIKKVEPSGEPTSSWDRLDNLDFS